MLPRLLVDSDRCLQVRRLLTKRFMKQKDHGQEGRRGRSGRLGVFSIAVLGVLHRDGGHIDGARAVIGWEECDLDVGRGTRCEKACVWWPRGGSVQEHA